MKFTKMQANGNDYIYVDTFASPLMHPEAKAVKWCDRHFGIGGDGLVLLCPSATCDFRMRIFDPDGTEAEVCGNALQCSAILFALSRGREKRRITVETKAGIRTVSLEWKDGSIAEVSAELGKPHVEFLGHPLALGDHRFPATSISFGNPHCVVLTEDLSDAHFLHFAPLLECHPSFPHRANVEFVQVVDRCHFRMRTWERGCGETLSCSTGTAAAVVAARLWGLGENEVLVEQRGGSIRCLWDEKNGRTYVYSQGTMVFEGTIEETE